MQRAVGEPGEWVAQRLGRIGVYEFPVVAEDGSVQTSPFYVVYGFAPTKYGLDVVRASRPRLEHAEMVDADGVARMARLGMVASVQPAFDAFWGGAAGMYEARLGRRAGAGHEPVRRRSRPPGCAWPSARTRR